MFCSKCGTQIEEGQKVCPKCGVTVVGQSINISIDKDALKKQGEEFVTHMKSDKRFMFKVISLVCLILSILVAIINVGGFQNGFANFADLFDVGKYFAAFFFWHLWFVVTLGFGGFIVFLQIKKQNMNFIFPAIIAGLSLLTLIVCGASDAGKLAAKLLGSTSIVLVMLLTAGSAAVSFLYNKKK